MQNIITLDSREYSLGCLLAELEDGLRPGRHSVILGNSAENYGSYLCDRIWMLERDGLLTVHSGGQRAEDGDDFCAVISALTDGPTE